jgi:hypothetical protein
MNRNTSNRKGFTLNAHRANRHKGILHFFESHENGLLILS